MICILYLDTLPEVYLHICNYLCKPINIQNIPLLLVDGIFSQIKKQRSLHKCNNSTRMQLCPIHRCFIYNRINTEMRRITLNDRDIRRRK